MPGVGDAEDSSEDVRRSGQKESFTPWVFQCLHDCWKEVGKGGCCIESQLHKSDGVECQIAESQLQAGEGTLHLMVVFFIGLFCDAQDG
jgi:hypothetical protein